MRGHPESPLSSRCTQAEPERYQYRLFTLSRRAQNRRGGPRRVLLQPPPPARHRPYNDFIMSAASCTQTPHRRGQAQHSRSVSSNGRIRDRMRGETHLCRCRNHSNFVATCSRTKSRDSPGEYRADCDPLRYHRAGPCRPRRTRSPPTPSGAATDTSSLATSTLGRQNRENGNPTAPTSPAAPRISRTRVARFPSPCAPISTSSTIPDGEPTHGKGCWRTLRNCIVKGN